MAIPSDQLFHCDGLPDISIKSFKDALRLLPLFDSNSAFHRLTEHVSRASNDQFIKEVSALVNSQPSDPVDSTNFEGPRGDYLTLQLAKSTIAVGISKISNDPNGLRRCVNPHVAKQVQSDVLTHSTFLLYADHVSQHMRSRGLPPLRRLNDFPGFIQAFVDDLLSQDTVDDMVDQIALHGGDASWVEGSLFVLQYFQNPKEPAMVPRDKIWDLPLGKAAVKWIEHADKTDKLGSVALATVKGLPISYGIQQDGFIRPPTSDEILQPLQAAPIQSDRNKILMQIQQYGGVQNWQSRAYEISVLWEGQQDTYNDRVQNYVNNRQKYSMIFPDPEAFKEAPPFAMFGFWIQGKEVVDYLRKNQSEPYISEQPGTYWDNQYRESPSPGGSSCFIPGTVIATHTGDKNIEDLQENDWILTRGDHEEWGIVSDEKVITPTDSPVIFGFNDENPFFTAGHVFHTTTGLRAVDPALAMTENPWADVGRLMPGHVIFRLAKEGGRYDQVPVLHINAHSMPEVKQVYGVHLREGRRSYHANGYLVMVNYPEFTLKRICNTLTKFSHEEQLRMLLAIDELNPLFKRFGIATISDMVKRELSEETRKNSARMYKVTDYKLGGISHASVAFEPEQIPSVDYSKLPSQLPTVTMFEGVVAVDGTICEYATVDGLTNTIQWSRSVIDLTGQIFEHGLLKIQDTQYYAARGQLIYSKDASGEQIMDLAPFQYLSYGSPCDFEITNKALSFSHHAQSLIATQPPSAEIQQPLTSSIAGAVSVDLSSGADEVLAQSVGAGAFGGSAVAVEGFAARAAAEEAPLETTFTVVKPVMSFMETTAPVGELIYVTKPKQYDMVYDTNPLQENQTQVQAQADFGPLQVSTQRFDAAQKGPGILFSDVILSDLDQLLVKLNEQRDTSSEEKIERLYDTSIVNVDKGRTQATVTIPPAIADILINLQDEKSAEDPSKKMTFKTNLKTDISLPLLFSRFEIIVAADNTVIESGILWEYNTDTSKAGPDGIRHFFVSRLGVSAQKVDARLGQGKVSGAIPTTSPTTGPSTPQKTPPVHQTMAPGDAMVQDIQTIFSSFNDDAVKTRSDQIFQNMMYYHMDPTHASAMTTKDTSTVQLPDYLGTNLSSTLSGWIKGTFGPAYTCLQIAQSLQTKDWKSSFTDKEKKKIIYFWEGQGPTCLSKSPEYAKLSKLCLREALLQLHPILQKFIGDNGKEWAKTYYEQLTNVKMDDIVDQCSQNPRFLDRYQLVLWTLDPDSQYSEEFRVEFYLKAYSQMVSQRANNDSIHEWLFHAVENFVNDVYNDTASGAGSEARKKLKEQMESFVKEQGIALEKEVKDKLTSIVANTIHQNITLFLATPGIRMLGLGIWRRSTAAMKNTAILDQSMKSGGKVLLSTALKGMILAFGAVFAVMNWSMLEDSQKAKICGDLARSTLDMLTPLLVKAETQTFTEFSASAALANQKMQMKHGAKWKTEFKSTFREYRKYVTRAERMAEMEATETTFWSRLKKKFSISSRLGRFLAIALSVVVIAFLIWDLVRSWSTLTTAGKALSVAQIVLESAAAVCALIGMFSASAVIPVIGQVCMVLALVVAIALLIWGQPEREKTPGEKFVDAMKDPNTGWLSKIDDPPATLLSYSVSPVEAKKKSDYTLRVTVANNTGHDVEIIPAQDDRSAPDPNSPQPAPSPPAPPQPAPDPPPAPPPAEPEQVSVDKIESFRLSFTTGSDQNCLFSNTSFLSTAEKTKEVGKCTFSGSSSIFKTKLLSPNGTIEGVTGYDFSVSRADVDKATKLIISSGSTFTIDLAGSVGDGERDFTFKLVESRPGAPYANLVQTIRKID